MDAVDREVLTLRHFEHLSNDETALVLGLTKKAASNRYIRALKRLTAHWPSPSSAVTFTSPALSRSGGLR